MAQLADLPTPIYRNEDVSLNFTMTPVEDITGWTFTCTVKRAPGDLTALLTITPTITVAASGTFAAAFTAAQTSTLPAGLYVYDVWRTDTNSKACLAIGAFPVAGTVRTP